MRLCDKCDIIVWTKMTRSSWIIVSVALLLLLVTIPRCYSKCWPRLSVWLQSNLTSVPQSAMISSRSLPAPLYIKLMAALGIILYFINAQLYSNKPTNNQLSVGWKEYKYLSVGELYFPDWGCGVGDEGEARFVTENLL